MTPTEQYSRNPLKNQILKPRDGLIGKLTNRACDARDPQGVCTLWVIKEYALDDGEFRVTANELGFVCNVAGRRFKICLDKPGYCRFSYRSKCFLGICYDKDRLEEYIPALEKHQFLVDANIRCKNPEVYPFDE